MLFIYGTLRKGCRNRHQIEKYIEKEEDASTVGTIFMRDGYKSPFLVCEGEGSIAGSLLTLSDEEANMLQLDIDEGPYYKRVLISATKKDGSRVAAWAYVCLWETLPSDADIIGSGDYVQHRALLGLPA